MTSTGATREAARQRPDPHQQDLSQQCQEADFQVHPQQLFQDVPKGPSHRQRPRGQTQPVVHCQPEVQEKHDPCLSGRRNMDLAKSGIKILVPKSPIKSRTAVDGFQSESPEKLDPVEQGLEDTVAPEVAAEKPVAALLGTGAERARMGSRPRIHSLVPQVSGPATAAMATGLAVNGKGTSPSVDARTANGATNVQTSVTGVTAGKRRCTDDRRDQPFDRRLCFSGRQTESAYRYGEIVVRKQDGFTHILLSTKSSENDALNAEVTREGQGTQSRGDERSPGRSEHGRG